MYLSINQRKSFSELLINISTAWFIGGIITPWFTHQNFSDIMISDGLISFLFCFLFLYMSWRINK